MLEKRSCIKLVKLQHFKKKFLIILQNKKPKLLKNMVHVNIRIFRLLKIPWDFWGLSFRIKLFVDHFLDQVIDARIVDFLKLFEGDLSVKRKKP